MKIIKATEQQKRNYLDQDPRPLHNLFGTVEVRGSLNGIRATWSCAVEYLGEGLGEPNYEVLAPSGMHFETMVHTILGTTQRDMLDQITELEQCGEDC